MKTALLTFIIIGYSQFCFGQEGIKPLELIDVLQLEQEDSLRFDLSGIVRYRERTFVVADKNWNNMLYEIETSKGSFKIVKQYPFQIQDKIDLEAIDYCHGNFFLANEMNGKVYEISIDSVIHESSGKSDDSLELRYNSLPISFADKKIDPESWGNAGWEGLSIDCKTKTMYLAKERSPKFLISIDMETWKIVDQFDTPVDNKNTDFSDLKFDQGYLYVVERNSNYVTKINPATGEIMDRFHYQHVASHSNGKLFGPTKYGMVEALLLLPDEIWLGIDNNGQPVTKHAKELYNMKGNSPVILRFKRPVGF